MDLNKTIIITIAMSGGTSRVTGAKLGSGASVTYNTSGLINALKKINSKNKVYILINGGIPTSVLVYKGNDQSDDADVEVAYPARGFNMQIWNA